MSAEKQVPEHSSQPVAKKANRAADKFRPGRNGLYLRNDSAEFIQRYIEPELHRIYGKIALRAVGNIDIVRSMTVPETDGAWSQLQVNVERNIKASVPLCAYITITERQRLSDEEVLVNWPLFEAIGMADDMQDAFVHATAHVLGAEDDDEVAEDDVLLMQRVSDVLGETDLAEEDITSRLFESEVSSFIRRTLVLQRRKRPELDFQTGFSYNEDDYSVVASGLQSPNENPLEGHVAEHDALALTSSELRHIVEHDSASDFIRALGHLGFRP